MKRYCIVTFGCQQNIADSERISASFENRGYKKVDDWKKADVIVINTCVVRQQAEDRVYGLVRNIDLHFQVPSSNSKVPKNKIPRSQKPKLQINNEISNSKEKKDQKRMPKIIVTGCLVGMAAHDKTGKILARLRERMPEVDEFLPISEVGFNLEPVRQDKENAYVVISNGCNNFCTFCVVPFTRGREVSRPFEEILAECKKLKDQGYKSVMLLGQNVNSYGADLVKKDSGKSVYQYTSKSVSLYNSKIKKKNTEITDNTDLPVYRSTGLLKPVMVKHLGRYRIPTLFPYLLEEVAKLGFEKVDFMSSNPWDFSDELIDVISRNKNITRQIHLPVQSGSDAVLKRMNRWYSAKEYENLISKFKAQISNIKFTTDIIVGFCGETEEEFKNTVKLCKKIGFEKAYVSIYSSRPMTGATISFKDDVPYTVKKKRWEELDRLINKKNTN